jgi:hypothetical protein
VKCGISPRRECALTFSVSERTCCCVPFSDFRHFFSSQKTQAEEEEEEQEEEERRHLQMSFLEQVHRDPFHE